MRSAHCPNCSSHYTRRVARQNFFERLLSILYVYPFRCQMCGHRFRQLQFGVRYRRVDVDPREFERLPVAFQAEIVTEDGQRYNAVLQNLSLLGCAFAVNATISLDSILRIDMQVPNVGRPIIVNAAAVRSLGKSHVGVEFLHMRDEERKRLRRLVAALLNGRRDAADNRGGEQRWEGDPVLDNYRDQVGAAMR